MTGSSKAEAGERASLKSGPILINDMTPAQRKSLRKAAMTMTKIVLEALDKFPPKERARRVKAYLGKNP